MKTPEQRVAEFVKRGKKACRINAEKENMKTEAIKFAAKLKKLPAEMTKEEILLILEYLR